MEEKKFKYNKFLPRRKGLAIISLVIAIIIILAILAVLCFPILMGYMNYLKEVTK